MNKVALYLRSATDNLTELKKQKCSIEKNLNRYGLQGCELILYSDNNQSGLTEGPSFSQLKSDIISGEINTLCVLKLNRISRSMKSLSHFYKFIKNTDLRFISTGENIDSLRWPKMTEVKNETH